MIFVSYLKGSFTMAHLSLTEIGKLVNKHRTSIDDKINSLLILENKQSI